MNQPSSTITAATLAGLGVSVFWAFWSWLRPGDVPPPELVSLSSTFVGALVGYFKHERVLPLDPAYIAARDGARK